MNTETIKKVIGSNIKGFREKAGFTQEQFAAMTNLSRGSITNIEKGKHSVPLATFYIICCILEVRPNLILPPIQKIELKTSTKTIVKKITKTIYKPVL
jgi:transcriptional regulator with XRE-family HTH domain